MKMVHYCILCKLCSRAADASITFHMFPKDVERKKKWLQAINMDQTSKFAQLCSNHFKSTDFKETIYGQRRIIKKTAIPTITSSETNFDDRDNEAASIKEECHTEIQTNTSNLKNTSEEESGNMKIKECSMESNNATKNNINSLERKSAGDGELDIPVKLYIKIMKNINVDEVSKNADEAKIVLEIAMEIIQEQQRQIHNLQSHRNKQRKRIKSLSALNKHLHDNNFISNKILEYFKIRTGRTAHRHFVRRNQLQNFYICGSANRLRPLDTQLVRLRTWRKIHNRKIKDADVPTASEHTCQKLS